MRNAQRGFKSQQGFTKNGFKTSRLSFSLLLLPCASLLSSCAKTPEKPAIAFESWGKFGHLPGQFKGPRAIATDEKQVFVADRASRISVWTTGGKFLRRWEAPVKRNGAFEGPEGIAALRNGDLAVTNTHSSRVLIYSKTGKLKSTFGSYGYEKGQFLLVTGITQDAQGFIYCADYGGRFDRISKWTSDGKWVAQWQGHGSAPRHFRRPCGLAISKNGDLLVADIGNHRVQILDRHTGKFKGQIASRGTQNGQLTYPYGVATDGAGQIYTLEYGTHRVQKWDKNGKWLASAGAPGRKKGEFANPWGIAVSRDGWVFVADTNNDRIQKFRF